MINIKTIVENELCTGCGTCVSLCSKDAIKITEDRDKSIYLPFVNNEKCIGCRICLQVCPQFYPNITKLYNYYTARSIIDGKLILGKYLNCYIGYANDSNVRFNSASGGLITALLLFALRERIIDGAIVTRMSKENPLRPEVILSLIHI